MKVCYVCKLEKDESEYYTDRSKKSGISSKCKKCSNRKHRDVPILKVIGNLKRRFREMIAQHEFEKTHIFLDVLGIGRVGLTDFLEKRFRDGMTWENYGKVWVIDHMLPLNKLESYDDLVRLSHYSNLQPLLVTENLKKGKSLTTESHLKKYFPYSEIMVNEDNTEIKIDKDKTIGWGVF